MSVNLQAGVSLLKTFATMVSPALKFTAMSVQTITRIVIELLALVNSIQGMTLLIILVALYFHAPQQFRLVGGLSSLYVAGKEFMKQAQVFVKSKIFEKNDLDEKNEEKEDSKSTNSQQCCEECVQDFFSQFEDRFDSKIQKLKDFLAENPQQLVILSNHLKSRDNNNLIDEQLFQNLLSKVN